MFELTRFATDFFPQYSDVIIKQMKERHQESRPEMEWLEMDVRKLQFETSSFEVAIDKGMLDKYILPSSPDSSGQAQWTR